MRSNTLFRAAVVATLAASTALLTAPSASADAGDDAIRAKHSELGRTGPPNGALGPIQSTSDGGKFAEFGKWGTMVTITWRSDVGAHWFSGALRARWVGAGGADKWGHAAIDQAPTSDGRGEAVRYTADISVYYSPGTGAKALFGPVRGKYWQLGSVSGRAGFPVTDVQAEPAIPDGQFADFQTGVSIYHSPPTNAHWISGAIRARFRTHGPGTVGFPTSDQFPTAGADGNYALFGPNRAILYGPRTGAWLVADDFLKTLRGDGDVFYDGLPKMERAPLEKRPEGAYQHFQLATMTSRGAGTDAWSVAYDMREAWWFFGGYTEVGLPTAREVWSNDFFTVTQTFENGTIRCDYFFVGDDLFVQCPPPSLNSTSARSTAETFTGRAQARVR